MSYDDVHQVLRDLGYADDTKPRGTLYVNPKFQSEPVESKPVEPEPAVEVESTPAKSTSDRPIPVGKQVVRPFEYLVGGHGGDLPDRQPTPAELADKHWRNGN